MYISWRSVIITTVIALVFTFLHWFLRDYFSEYVSNYIQIRTDAILMAAFWIPTLIIFLRKVNRQQPEISLVSLILNGTFPILFSEIVFQLYRQVELNFDSFAHRIIFYFKTVCITSFMLGFWAFLIAHQLKTKKTMRTIFLYFAFALLFNLLQKYFNLS